jgi:formylglycine-generating enzyme required for sulfatase activity
MTSEALAAQRPQTTWRDHADLPLMVLLSAGEFVMGENTGDKFANDTERPAHRVKISKDFALGCFPVTVGEFRRFRPGHAPGEAAGLPVVRVGWQDSIDYCEWLTCRSGRAYRLASEAEWEFCCRAGARSPFGCGDEISPLLANYLYDESGGRIGRGGRTRAGSYSPNAFGLYDLHGNVCEWVEDNWHQDYHGAPEDGAAWTENGDTRRVIRGGAWDYLPRLLRSAWRDWRTADCRADNVGFRVATDDLRNVAAA